MFRRFSQLPSGRPANVQRLAQRRLTTAFLGSLLALGSAGVLHAAPRHPNLFVNAEEMRQLRLRLKTEAWRARLLEQVKQDADAGNPVAASVVYALTENPVDGEKVHSHLVRQAKDFVPGRPGAQYPWGPEAGPAIAFDLGALLLSDSEQQAVADFLRQLALDAIQYHTRQPLTPNMSFVCHWRIGLIGCAIADAQIIQWAVNDPGPPWGGQQPGRWGGFKQRIEHALTDGAFWDEAPIYGNFSILGMMYLAEAARHYDGIDLYNYTSPNGGSLRKAIAGLVSLAYPIERTGVDRGSVRMATWGDGSTAPPNRVNNESGDAFFVNKPNIFPERQNLYPILEIAYHAWKDPQYAYLLALNPRRDERLGWFEYLPVSLLLGETLPAETPPAAMPSIVYPQTGIALLRSDESPGYWTSVGLVALQQMGRNYGHDHRDKFELLLWGRGRLLYPDWNAQQYEPMEYGWTRNAWAHNTLVVDESNPKGGRSTERHEFSAEAKFLATTSREIYPDVTQTRALLLTGDYLLDLFWADSPRERTYDWFVHALGQLSLPAPHGFQPSQDLQRPYHWVDRERKWETDRTWSADFVQRSGGVLRGMGQYTDEWFSAKVGVRMTMLGEPGTAAYAGEGLFNPVPNLREHGNPEGTIPLAMARRKARTTCFAALHEPFDGRPSLVARRVDQRPAAIGVCVAGDAFTDYACVSCGTEQGAQAVTLTDAADAYQSFSFADYGYLRVKQGQLIARGTWRSFRVAAPQAAPSGGLMLNGREASYRKLGDYVVFNDSAAPPRTNPRREAAVISPVTAPDESRLPPNASVTIQEAERHPQFPMWIVRAPGYELQIHRKFGVSRTLIDGHGQLLFGSEWWGGSGVFEVRLPTGAEETAPFAWNHPAKEIRWRGPAMEVTAPNGESFTATFGEHAIRYGFHGKPNVDYRASIQSFFWHATGRLRTAKDPPPAGLPLTLGNFHWTCIQNPGLSPDCVLLLTPRQPAEWSHRPANISAFWPLRDGERFFLVFGPEDKLPSLADEAVRGP
jgi:Heparinase II/III-like protein